MPALLLSIAYLTLIFAAIAGYVMNIISIFSNFDVFGAGEAVVRIAGIFIPFVGAIVGWF